MADRPTEGRTLSDDNKGAPDLAALKAENESLHDRLLRALADAENVRRRSDRAAHDARDFAVADLSRELLTVVDNLRRAIAAAEDPGMANAGSASLVEGIKAIERSFMTILERRGVRQLEACGTPFDPFRHEAILEIDDPERAPGTIVDVMEEGYTIHDRLLRPSKVSVARGSASAAADGSARPVDRRLSSANRDE